MTESIGHRAVPAPYAQLDITHTRWWDHLWDKALLLLVAAGDFVSFWIALQLFNPNATWWQTAVLVSAMTAAAVVLMHKAGSAARAVKARQAAHGKTLVRVLVLAWIALGAAAFIVRWQSTDGASSRISLSSSTAATGASNHSLIMAIMMLTLYIGGGVAAFAIGYWTYSPPRKAARRLERSRQQAEKAHRKQRASLQAKLDELDTKLGPTEQGIAHLEDLRRHQHSMLIAQANELKQIARLRSAEALRQPAKTTGVFSDPMRGL